MPTEAECWEMFINLRKRGWNPQAGPAHFATREVIPEWDAPAEPIVTGGAGTEQDIKAPAQGSQLFEEGVEKEAT